MNGTQLFITCKSARIWEDIIGEGDGRSTSHLRGMKKEVKVDFLFFL